MKNLRLEIVDHEDQESVHYMEAANKERKSSAAAAAAVKTWQKAVVATESSVTTVATESETGLTLRF